MSTPTYESLTTTIAERVRDAAGKLSLLSVQIALRAALEEYTRDRPREVTISIDGTGSFDYACSAWGAAQTGSTASTQWVSGQSILRRVVYPYSASSRDLYVLEPGDFDILRLPSGDTLRFKWATPSATEDILLTFTRPHEANADVVTVEAGDVQAVCSLAGACALESLAAYYAQATDSTIDADVVDHRARTGTYLELARALRQAYYAHVGRRANGQSAASASSGGFVDTDRSFGDLVRTDYFAHGRRRY